MAFEVRSGRVHNNCDHKGEAYCKAVYSVDRDLDDIDVAAQIQEAKLGIVKLISTFHSL